MSTISPLTDEDIDAYREGEGTVIAWTVKRLVATIDAERAKTAIEHDSYLIMSKSANTAVRMMRERAEAAEADLKSATASYRQAADLLRQCMVSGEFCPICGVDKEVEAHEPDCSLWEWFKKNPPRS